MLKKVAVGVVGTILVLSVIFYRIDYQAIVSLLSGMNVLWIFLMFLWVSAATLAVDLFSFGDAYKRYLIPGIQFKTLLQLRSITLLVVATIPPLAMAVSLGYFTKLKKLPIRNVIGVEAFITCIDLVAGASLFSVGVLLYFGNALSAFAVVLLCLLLTAIGPIGLKTFFRKTVSKRFNYQSSILSVFITASSSEYLYYFLVRLSLAGIHLIVLMMLLNLFGIELSFSNLLIFSPLFVASAFLPISVGTLGGPQGVAALLLVELWSVTDLEMAIAMSLVWSSMYLFTRVLVGLSFSYTLIANKKTILMEPSV